MWDNTSSMSVLRQMRLPEWFDSPTIMRGFAQIFRFKPISSVGEGPPLVKLFSRRRAVVMAGAFFLFGTCVGLGQTMPQPITSRAPGMVPPAGHPAGQAPPPAQTTPTVQGGAAGVSGASNVAGVSSLGQTGYVISAGDTLDITVYDAQDLSDKSVVNARGDIYMPLVDHVHVGGLNVEDAQTVIEHALQMGGFVKSPHVRVAVAEYAHGVTVMGEVVKPGIYPISSSQKLFDVLTEAGGPAATAGQRVTVTHFPAGTQETVELSYDPADLVKNDVWVHQGDTVVVAKAGVVYIVGEVLQPSGFVMQDRTDYTVLKVVAMAHGTTKIAKLSQVKIVRKTPAGLTEIPVSLDRILASKSPDVALLPDDIVFVPKSKGKNAAYTSADVAVSMISGLGIIAVSRF